MNHEPQAIHVAIQREAEEPLASSDSPSGVTSENPPKPPEGLLEEPTPSREENAPAENRVFHTPLIDIHEGPEGLILEADLPGAMESGITIQLEENVLTLHAEVPNLFQEGEVVRGRHEEYRVSDYFRSFILSDEVDRTRITAELKNGVLRLTLPKAERAKTRRIEIKS